MLLLEDLSHPKPSYVFVTPGPVSALQENGAGLPRHLIEPNTE
jgi:hypothetical protein